MKIFMFGNNVEYDDFAIIKLLSSNHSSNSNIRIKLDFQFSESKADFCVQIVCVCIFT